MIQCNALVYVLHYDLSFCRHVHSDRRNCDLIRVMIRRCRETRMLERILARLSSSLTHLDVPNRFCDLAVWLRKV